MILAVRCLNCDSINVAPTESMIEGLYLRKLLTCHCCNSIFTYEDENDNVKFLHIGEKK